MDNHIRLKNKLYDINIRKPVIYILGKKWKLKKNKVCWESINSNRCIRFSLCSIIYRQYLIFYFIIFMEKDPDSLKGKINEYLDKLILLTKCNNEKFEAWPKISDSKCIPLFFCHIFQYKKQRHLMFLVYWSLSC